MDVEQRLPPDELRRWRQGRAADVGEGAVEVGEGAVGRDRQPDRLNGRGRQPLAASVEVEVGRDPAVGGFHEQVARAQLVEVQDAPVVDRELHLLHRFERRAHEHLEPVGLLLDQHLDRDAAGDLVGGSAFAAGKEQRCGEKGAEEKGGSAVVVGTGTVQGVNASRGAPRQRTRLAALYTALESNHREGRR